MPDRLQEIKDSIAKTYPYNASGVARAVVDLTWCVEHIEELRGLSLSVVGALDATTKFLDSAGWMADA